MISCCCFLLFDPHEVKEHGNGYKGKSTRKVNVNAVSLEDEYMWHDRSLTTPYKVSSDAYGAVSGIVFVGDLFYIFSRLCGAQCTILITVSFIVLPLSNDFGR